MGKPAEVQLAFCLFMIFAAGLNGFAAVKLLQHHDPGQVMGKGHGPHGK